jgi:hypothetical protein
MDDNPTDIAGTRGTGHQNTVLTQSEVGVFVCIMDIPNDLLRVKQHDEIMREERGSIYLQFEVGEQYGPGFSHIVTSPHEPESAQAEPEARGRSSIQL